MLQQGAGRVQPIVHDELREGHPLATPELLHGTPLARRMHEFTFFAYQANEALHMTANLRAFSFSFIKVIVSESCASALMNLFSL